MLCLTILVLDTDAEHSQDVGRLKALHGVHLLLEYGLHCSAERETPWQWVRVTSHVFSDDAVLDVRKIAILLNVRIHFAKNLVVYKKMF